MKANELLYVTLYLSSSSIVKFILDTLKNIDSDFVNTSWQIPSSPTIQMETNLNVTLSKGTTYYKFCGFDHLNTRDQRRIVSVFNYLGFVNVGIVSSVFLVAAFLLLKSYYNTKYEVRL